MTGGTPHEETAELRAALLEGDEAAARRLYLRNAPVLIRLALRLGPAPDQAEDLVHETWLRAARGAGRFGGQSRVGTWLVGILINTAREWRRAVQRAAEVEFEEEMAPPVLPPPGVDRVDLERALGSLPHGYREVLLLHDVEGYRHEEIAAALGIAAGTSRSQLARARRAMVRALRAREGG